MSVWIRALCTKPLASVTPAALLAGVRERLADIASIYGEDDPETAAESLQVSDGWDLSWAGGGPIGGERWTKPEAVKEEVDELLGSLADSDEDGVEDVRELLGQVVESVGFELKVSDCEGIGWPVAIAAAAFLAEVGEGLVQADGEGYMEPDGLSVAQVLDGD